MSRTDLANRTVSKANDLIQKSRFSLSLQQQKVVLYLISQINANDTDFKLYDFMIADFCRVCGIDVDSGGNYINLKNTLQQIANKSVWITLPNKQQTLVRWIEKPYIDSQRGTIRIKLDADMKPFLLQLKKQYTRYQLIYTLRFKSKYSIRLYEYIKSVHYNELSTYQQIISIGELKRIMGAEIYDETRDFKRKSLNPAVKEINKYSDKDLIVEEIKKGRKITHLNLIISTKDAMTRYELTNI